MAGPIGILVVVIGFLATRMWKIKKSPPHDMYCQSLLSQLSRTSSSSRGRGRPLPLEAYPQTTAEDCCHREGKGAEEVILPSEPPDAVPGITRSFSQGRVSVPASLIN